MSHNDNLWSSLVVYCDGQTRHTIINRSQTDARAILPQALQIFIRAESIIAKIILPTMRKFYFHSLLVQLLGRKECLRKCISM